MGLPTKRRLSTMMPAQENHASSATTLQLRTLACSRVGDIIEVTTQDGVVVATLVTYDRFNHSFQATLEDNAESTFPASALFCPGKYS